MYPIAFFFAFTMAILGMTGLGLEAAHLKADVSQQAERYADQSLPAAMQAFATQIGQQVKNSQTFTAYHADPTAICSVGAATCSEFVTENVSFVAGTVQNPSGSETSQNVDSFAGEQRISAIATATITDANGTQLAKRQRIFTLRTYNFSPYATIVNAYDATGTGVADADIAGCDVSQGCGDMTNIKAYAACRDTGAYAAPDPTAQSWEDASCTQRTAPTTTATPDPTWNYLENSNYQTQTWSNSNSTSQSWRP